MKSCFMGELYFFRLSLLITLPDTKAKDRHSPFSIVHVPCLHLAQAPSMFAVFQCGKLVPSFSFFLFFFFLSSIPSTPKSKEQTAYSTTFLPQKASSLPLPPPPSPTFPPVSPPFSTPACLPLPCLSFQRSVSAALKFITFDRSETWAIIRTFADTNAAS